MSRKPGGSRQQAVGSRQKAGRGQQSARPRGGPEGLPARIKEQGRALIICPCCSYPNGEYDHRCERCGRRFDAPAGPEPGDGARADDFDSQPFPADLFSPEVPSGDEPPWRSAATEQPPPAPSREENEAPPWRGELSDRVKRFRRRRASQGLLPFEEAGEEEAEGGAAAASPPSRTPRPVNESKVIRFEEIAARAGAARSAGVGRSLSSARPEAVPAGRQLRPSRLPKLPESREAPGPAGVADTRPSRRPGKAGRASIGTQAGFAFAEPQPLGYPVAPYEASVEAEVAPIALRAIAAACDSALLAAGTAAFLGAYTLAGGKFPVHRAGLAALLAAVGLVAVVFLFFFLFFSNNTPGVRLVGMRLVDFEGRPARRDQRMLRLFGMITSALALGFGYLWALADEDGLTWHDRISHTCLVLDASPFVRRADK